MNEAYYDAEEADDYLAEADAVAAFLPAEEHFLSQIESLTPSPSDMAAFSRYVLLTRRILGFHGRVADALRAKDGVSAMRIGDDLLDPAVNQTIDAAVDLGTTQC